mgnify:CR=1 FL=1
MERPHPGGVVVAAFIFWLSVLFIAYTYLGYPCLMGLIAHVRPRPIHRQPGHAPRLSIVIAARNEAHHIVARLKNLQAQHYPGERIEIIVVSDGSTDSTAQQAQRMAVLDDRIRVLERGKQQGKAASLNEAVAEATGEIVVFTDARQRFAPDALSRLAENFADPAMGAVSGQLVLTHDENGVAAQVSLYWRYEKWIRRAESTGGSMLGATGAIYAIRRKLYRALPAGLLLDDFLVPMRIVLRGQRAGFDERALAYDRSSVHAGQEFRRKVRTLAGNFQAFAVEPALLIPWRNRSTWFQLWSHKLFRLIVPYALVFVLLSSLMADGWFYFLLAGIQVVFYAAAVAAWRLEVQGHTIQWRLVSLAYTFSTLNLAAVLGLWFWLTGIRADRLWQKTDVPTE